MLQLKKLVRVYNGINGLNRTMMDDELTVCYTFVDIMFSRKFFLLVSWTGSSKCVPKKALRDFGQTIEFFTVLVRQIHPLFSHMSCQMFFKNRILSNCKSRAEKPYERASRPRFRKKPQELTSVVDDNESGQQSMLLTNDDRQMMRMYVTPSAILQNRKSQSISPLSGQAMKHHEMEVNDLVICKPEPNASEEVREI